jgi:RpiB/LacA/LacB family sugar-phosphate isomerase
MNIYIAADHNGYQMKNDLAKWLQAEGHTVIDMGPASFNKEDDYPDYGIEVARAVAKDPQQRFGILLCGSGVGMSVVADKVPGIRAAMIHDPDIAEAAQRDDDINVLALGAKYISTDNAKKVIQAWLKTPFAGAERFVRRINKIKQFEKEHLGSGR